MGRTVLKTYQIPIPRKKKAALPQYLPKDTRETETFTGEIQGLPASDIEERSARSLDKLGASYQFRNPYIAGRNLPGEVELDFLVEFRGISQPVQVDGEFAHKSGAQRAEDRMKDAFLMDALGPGYLPVIRVPGDKSAGGPGIGLQNQEDSDATWKEVLNA